MDAYSIVDAAGRLDELVHRVEAGEDVAIIRDGRVVARLMPAATGEKSASFDWNAHRKWADAVLPLDPANAVIEMRKNARY